MATKKCLTKKFFHPSLFYLFLDPGSGIRDPGSGMGKNQDPGSGINIPDPQHCLPASLLLKSFLWIQVQDFKKGWMEASPFLFLDSFHGGQGSPMLHFLDKEI